MTEPTPYPPPPVPTRLDDDPSVATDTTDSQASRPTWQVVAITAAIAFTLAIAVGVAVGYSVYAASGASCDPSDGWCDLGAALVGLVAGVVIGGPTYVVATVATIARLRPRTERAKAVIAVMATPFVTFIGLHLLSAGLDLLL
ncbi:MAG: hypothetical protein ABIP17_16715 [Ilumatobacteraceae bacterium]